MHSDLRALGLKPVSPGVFDGGWRGCGECVAKCSPIDGRVLARVRHATRAEARAAVGFAHEAFLEWRSTPAPVRGETVRQLGEAFRRRKSALARLVTLETGKLIGEAEGEVQEMIDICDFATGLSRQLHGLTMPSERRGHRLMEQWHPLGVVGVITAFNFPAAVWSWNAALASVCGDAVVWKPSSKTPLTAIAVTRIAETVCHGTGANPAIFGLVVGSPEVAGDALLEDKRAPLISATGSCRMGGTIAAKVGARFGRTLLELGGNNAVIVAPSADPDLAVRAIFFGAIGTAGQRCTSTRRVILHASRFADVRDRLLAAYRSLRIGDPLDRRTVMGPLVDAAAVADVQTAIARLKRQGGEVLCGGEPLRGRGFAGGCYVTPCIAVADNGLPIVQEETFGPLLYLMRYENFADALAMNNAVPQGLSSACFTRDQREAEQFLSACGSDCGLANINCGTSGAEIGGAFGGEKATGGGRESGSDSWKAYMRRQTSAVNYSDELPLAQGIEFGGG
ncbi:MAG: aldehyde dehydrogenase family protein [Verrucomicrobia bacterium]|nr:aldehyde dehydrogenase family protein [Verrucomicrobiota bacterium]